MEVPAPSLACAPWRAVPKHSRSAGEAGWTQRRSVLFEIAEFAQLGLGVGAQLSRTVDFGNDDRRLGSLDAGADGIDDGGVFNRSGFSRVVFEAEQVAYAVVFREQLPWPLHAGNEAAAHLVASEFQEEADREFHGEYQFQFANRHSIHICRQAELKLGTDPRQDVDR